MSIGADAHSIAGLRHVPFGVGMARKGWLTKRDILNARPSNEFLTHAASAESVTVTACQLDPKLASATAARAADSRPTQSARIPTLALRPDLRQRRTNSSSRPFSPPSAPTRE